MNYHIKKISVFIICVSFLLSACSGITWEKNQKAIIGGVGGATAGGLIASAFDANTAGVLGGILLGGLIGSAVGDRMDAADRREANETALGALESNPSGTTTTWQNPNSGNSGTFTPTRSYQSKGGEYCREYEQSVTIGGETQQAYGTACRQPDGNWRLYR